MKLKQSLMIFLVLAMFAPLSYAGDAQPARFEKEIQAQEALDKKSPPPEGAILFTGASGIRMWKTLDQDFAEYKVFNRAFGGSMISDCIHFMDRNVLPYKPKQIVIQAGGNDINAGKTPETVLADFKTYVEKVREKLPDVRISFLNLNPSPSRWAQFEKQKAANALVKAWIATQKNIDYIDIVDALLGADGKPREDLFIADKLHPNAEGYKIRTAAVRPFLMK